MSPKLAFRHWYVTVLFQSEVLGSGGSARNRPTASRTSRPASAYAAATASSLGGTSGRGGVHLALAHATNAFANRDTRANARNTVMAPSALWERTRPLRR